MKVRNFRELSEPIKADPQRAANLARHRAATLAEIAPYNPTELAEALGMTPPSVSRTEHTGDVAL